MSAAALNEKFGLSTSLRFTDDASGLVVVDIENPLASARICLQGAHLLSWRPRSSSIPVVWLSEGAQLTRGKSPHSGAPICWPWFGAHESNPAFPAHGYARNLPWEVVATRTEANGATCITLRLLESEQARAQWPNSTQLELTMTVGDTLKMDLNTRNTGTQDIVISEAFHTYFQVGDIAKAQVTGLEGCTFADKVVDFARSVQQGPITFDGEVDRVYVNTAADCIIEDPSLHRRIIVKKSGSLATVVWTPGEEKGNKLGDLGTDGWRRMVCVESANTMENCISIPAGGSHTLTVEYQAQPL